MDEGNPTQFNHGTRCRFASIRRFDLPSLPQGWATAKFCTFESAFDSIWQQEHRDTQISKTQHPAQPINRQRGRPIKRALQRAEARHLKLLSPKERRQLTRWHVGRSRPDASYPAGSYLAIIAGKSTQTHAKPDPSISFSKPLCCLAQGPLILFLPRFLH